MRAILVAVFLLSASPVAAEDEFGFGQVGAGAWRGHNEDVRGGMVEVLGGLLRPRNSHQDEGAGGHAQFGLGITGENDRYINAMVGVEGRACTHREKACAFLCWDVGLARWTEQVGADAKTFIDPFLILRIGGETGSRHVRFRFSVEFAKQKAERNMLGESVGEQGNDGFAFTIGMAYRFYTGVRKSP